MKKALRCLFLFFFAGQLLQAQPTMITVGATTLETSTLHTTTEPPWELKYGPGELLWMTTKNGKVYQLNPNDGTTNLLLDHSANVYQAGEAGMLGMTFHPNFDVNPYVYIAYTYSDNGNKERLSRFTYNGTALVSEQVLVDGIVANTIHNGSRLLILPDNTLLMTTGDAANTAFSQNAGSLNGKILRLNLDGSIPANNPVAGSTVYTLGHRNAQGLALHPTGKIFSTEHGPSNNDEFQLVNAGRNYGWPAVAGFCDDDQPGETAFCTANNVQEPLISWTPAPGSTWAPSDLVWYDHPSIPEFQQSFLVAFLKTAKVTSVRLNATGDAVTSQADFFVNQWGRLRDITVGPNGAIYIATNTSPYRIIKIQAAGVLPVAITNYDVWCNQQLLTIRWTTQMELNNKQFQLYKSTDGFKFDLLSAIASQAPGGNSALSIDYSVNDAAVPSGPVFYKLMSEDLDGRKRDLGIVSPSCGAMGNRFSLLPNPTSQKSVLTMNEVREMVNVMVHNATGQAVYQNRGLGTITLPADQWPPGVYFITIVNQQKEIIWRNKLVVQ